MTDLASLGSAEGLGLPLGRVDETAPGRRRFEVKTAAEEATVFSAGGERYPVLKHVNVYEHVLSIEKLIISIYIQLFIWLVYVHVLRIPRDGVD
jgi:hypothetical protein